MERAPHFSAMQSDAMKYAQQESAEKVQGGFAKIFLWDDIKNNPPPNTKVLPISMIKHKSQRYRGILDLLLCLRIKGYYVPSVNESSANRALDYLLAQLGVVIPRLIQAIAESRGDGIPIFMSKLDVKDGFWQIFTWEGAEWNFAYILPDKPGQKIRLVVPTSIQMG